MNTAGQSSSTLPASASSQDDLDQDEAHLVNFPEDAADDAFGDVHKTLHPDATKDAIPLPDAVQRALTWRMYLRSSPKRSSP